MVEAQPVDRAAVPCRHCPELITKESGENDWWRSAKGALICDPKMIDLKHQPMPAI